MNHHFFLKQAYQPLIKQESDANLGLIVTIPAYDEPNWQSALQSIMDCNRPNCGVEVFILFNHSAQASEIIKEKHQQDFEKALQIANRNQPSLKIFPFIQSFNPKEAGVGLARKTLMDEAAYRLLSAKHPNAVISCFDADSKVQANYLLELQTWFARNPKLDACSIAFEHQLDHQEIIAYELHLRYYIDALKWCGFPFAIQTIGSSMAVRAKAYLDQGGMNKRQAGEDFYFLQKYASIQKIGACNSTSVYPSSRASHRVPFGTGKKVHELQSTKSEMRTYAFEHMRFLKKWVRMLPELYVQNESLESLHPQLLVFFKTVRVEQRLDEIRRNTSSKNMFVKRVHQWFNAFKVMKCLHFLREQVYSDQEVLQEANLLLAEKKLGPFHNHETALLEFRKLDKKLFTWL